MKHYIKDDKYYIVNEEGKVLLTIELSNNESEQIIIKTNKEVYAGPINLLTF